MEEHPEARLIVETLTQAGFIAYYAGGWVRDFLLQLPSDDIDIATNAPPEKIQELFSHTVPIGLSFGILLVLIGDKKYEVATFRRDLDYTDGRRPTEIAFATPEEDAKRRDFTINGMFYDPLREQVLDFVGGQNDLQAKIIRAIGDPHQRIREDRLRMIRAVRLSCRFSFPIEPATEAAIHAHAAELFPAVAIERVTQELEKGRAFRVLPPMLHRLLEFKLLLPLFPHLEALSFSDIEQLLAPLYSYPEATPLSLFLYPLLSDPEALCQKMKLSRRDLTLLLFYETLQKTPWEADDATWAPLYANPAFEICFPLLTAPQHEPRRERLARSIAQLQSGTPVLTSAHLKSAGVKPGKEMGRLLKEGERLSINEQIFSAEEILKRLGIERA